MAVTSGTPNDNARDATVTDDEHRVDPEVRRKDASTGDSAAPAAAPPSDLLPLSVPPSQSQVAIILGPSDRKHLICAGSKSKPIKAAPAASGKNRRPPVSPTAPAANRGSARSPFR
ncbi:hypothetical protein PAHAL_2G148200 [Panicum hallii]|uniref:Uncharacterized protein n=1 Tax=Panicum hallii TaxID=206008 RepID=A0A2S3GYP3_9POAL|nr:hypothetical protein PAHAL_2G148200 [Panicum hallii]